MIWKEKYRVGVAGIDGQHEELFQRVTDFVETLRAQVPWKDKVDQVNLTMAFMKDYVVSHFRDEEAYQDEIGYPGREAHLKLHRDMLSYVVEVAAQYEETGYQEQLIQQFAGKLLAWLINHVTFEDQKIAAYAARKGASTHE